MSDDQTIVGAAVLAAIFRCTERQIRGNLLDDGTVVKVSRGKYDLIQSVHNYIDALTSRNLDDEMDAERLRELTERRIKNELHNQRQRRELLPTQQVLRAWSMACSGMRQRFLRMGNTLGHELSQENTAAVCSDRIDTFVRETLDSLSTLTVDDYDPDFVPVEDETTEAD